MSVIEAPVTTEPLAEPFTVPEYDEREKAALNYINGLRMEFGFSPIEALPQGLPSQSDKCVIARGIRQGTDLEAHQGRVETAIARVGLHFAKFTTPLEVCDFINDFDTGKYPQHLAK